MRFDVPQISSAALDHAKIGQSPGGPAERVPGQHHVRINMYIAQATGGKFSILSSLGMIEPKEAVVPDHH
jgi:branched-chain amino acid transport system substrate-binding protein